MLEEKLIDKYKVDISMCKYLGNAMQRQVPYTAVNTGQFHQR